MPKTGAKRKSETKPNTVTVEPPPTKKTKKDAKEKDKKDTKDKPAVETTVPTTSGSAAAVAAATSQPLQKVPMGRFFKGMAAEVLAECLQAEMVEHVRESWRHLRTSASLERRLQNETAVPFVLTAKDLEHSLRALCVDHLVSRWYKLTAEQQHKWNAKAKAHTDAIAAKRRANRLPVEDPSEYVGRVFVICNIHRHLIDAVRVVGHTKVMAIVEEVPFTPSDDGKLRSIDVPNLPVIDPECIWRASGRKVAIQRYRDGHDGVFIVINGQRYEPVDKKTRLTRAA